MMKRLLDLVVSITGLLLLSPIWGSTALLVKVKYGSPVLFKQERIGYQCNVFTVYKFRSMSDTKDDRGNLLPDSKRITKFGRFIRKTSIDELPQLWNVIRGDMSLVGPRPLLVHYLPYYTSEENIRHSVKPGITGLAQISGRNRLTWDRKLAYDVEYVKKRSMKLDLIIIGKTILKVFKREGMVEVQREMMLDLDIERQGKTVTSYNK
jgi:undecaprenyl phosphate N,N'-diacetylbacillosamine 1-phosphate transferase